MHEHSYVKHLDKEEKLHFTLRIWRNESALAEINMAYAYTQVLYLCQYIYIYVCIYMQ
jgi:hypothetical protein